MKIALVTLDWPHSGLLTSTRPPQPFTGSCLAGHHSSCFSRSVACDSGISGRHVLSEDVAGKVSTMLHSCPETTFLIVTVQLLTLPRQRLDRLNGSFAISSSCDPSPTSTTKSTYNHLTTRFHLVPSQTCLFQHNLLSTPVQEYLL